MPFNVEQTRPILVGYRASSRPYQGSMTPLARYFRTVFLDSLVRQQISRIDTPLAEKPSSNSA